MQKNQENKLQKFKVIVNNSPLSEKILQRITEIRITEYIQPPNRFCIEVFDPDLKGISAKDSDETMNEGSMIEIHMGYGTEMKKMMVGEVASVEIELSGSNHTLSRIEGFDLLHRLTRGTCYRKFEASDPEQGMPDSEIVTKIADEMQLNAVVDKTPELLTARIQENVSNLNFLRNISEANGFSLWCKEKDLFFKKERPSEKETVLEWGINLLGFSARLSTAGLVNTVMVQGWDSIKSERFEYKADRSAGSSKFLSKTGVDQLKMGAGKKSELSVCDSRIFSKEEAQRYAQKLMADQEGFVIASGTTTGDPEIRAGGKIRVQNAGRFSGSYIVEEVTHVIGGSGYKTSFQVRMKI